MHIYNRRDVWGGEDYMVDWPYLLEQSRKMAEESMRIKLANWLLKRWYVVDEAAAVAWVDAEGGDIPQDVKDYMYQLAKHEREHVQRALKRQATKVSRSRAASPAASDEDRTESDSLDG